MYGADLTEDTAAESDSGAECTANTGEGTATRRGPLRTPTPSQVVLAAARARSKKAKRKGKKSEGGRTEKGASVEGDNKSSDRLDSNDSDGSTCTVVAQDELSVE